MWSLNVVVAFLLSVSNNGSLMAFGKSSADAVVTDDYLGSTILEFLQKDRKVAHVNFVRLCWKNSIKAKFARELNANGFFVKSLSAFTATTESSVTDNLQFYVCDVNCPNSELVIKQANESAKFNFPSRWFVISRDQNLTFDRLQIWLNSRFYLSTGNKTIESYWRINNPSNRYLKTEINLENFTAVSDYKRANHWQLVTLPVATFIVYNRSLDHMEDRKYLNEDVLSKHNYPLMKHLMDIFNTSFAFYPRTFASKRWSSKNREFNGIIEDLQNGDAVISGTAILPTSHRATLIDFVSDPTKTDLAFILKEPALSSVSNVLTMPLATSVWISCLVMFALISGVLWVIARWEFRSGETAETLRKGYVLRLRSRYSDVLQMEIGIVCQQGPESMPESVAGRVATLFALLASLFIYTAYTANIVALLQSTSDRIQSIEDLLVSDIKLGIDDLPYSRAFVLRQTGNIRQRILKEKLFPNNEREHVFSNAAGVEKLRTEFFAFHAERDPIYKQISKTYLEHEKCGLREIKFLVENEPYIVCPKRSIYKQIFTISYSRMREHGLPDRIHKAIYNEKPKCTNSAGNFTSVGLNDCYFALMCFILGFLIAIFILVCENLYRFHAEHKKLLHLHPKQLFSN